MSALEQYRVNTVWLDFWSHLLTGSLWTALGLALLSVVYSSRKGHKMIKQTDIADMKQNIHAEQLQSFESRIDSDIHAAIFHGQSELILTYHTEGTQHPLVTEEDFKNVIKRYKTNGWKVTEVRRETEDSPLQFILVIA